MPIESPFHARTAPLCVSRSWRDWAGYFTAASYAVTHEREYNAIRQSVGVIDVTPLFKYDVTGEDAARYLGRVCVRSFNTLKVGQVCYTCWCDDDGKVVDDGTISRLSEDTFRLTAAEPMLYWLVPLARGYKVQVNDVTDQIAALAIQGPLARELLKQCTDADLDALPFFGTTAALLDGLEVRISRTGYTGDLGYELWVNNIDAIACWDRLFDAGASYAIEPCGMYALDQTRIEAGFIMAGVDYL